MTPIAHIETPFRSKFGVPRQAGLVDYEARVVFEPDYRIPEAVRGLEEFDYIWLLWQFHLNNSKFRIPNSELSWSPTVRPPRLGGNKRVGVFATRSPFRPNNIGLSSVRLLRVAVEPALGPVLYVSGADLVDGTPVFDIKPYIPYADSHPGVRSGFAPDSPTPRLTVADPQQLLSKLNPDQRKALIDALALDPRPHYQDDPSRRYVMPFGEVEVAFTVEGEMLNIVNVSTI